MDLKKIKKTTDQMIKHFVDALGLDGEYYISCMDCPIVFGSTLGLGKFYSAEAPDLKIHLEHMLIPEKQKKEILKTGLIVINSSYLKKEMDAEFISTIIHETFHSNRMLLINTQNKPDPDIESVLDYKNRFVQTSDGHEPLYADANQEIVHGSIDNSRNAIAEIKNLGYDKQIELTDFDDKVYLKRELYQYVDETLVELMALLSIYLVKQDSTDVMDMIKRINRNFEGDIKSITNIIIRHDNLDLLKWMLDPLTYQADDITYDYLKFYLNDDDYPDLNDIIRINEEYGFESILEELESTKKAK